MADIAIVVTGFGEGAAAGNFRVSFSCQESSTHLTASSEVEIAYNSNASQVNTAITNAAIAVYAPLGIIIGAGDKKILMGGAA